ncbi:hypothetical protein [Candidiatus Paracoxiella cheracis]|uniref:hypothetical protein n=1 Tax=Candidiatus Paracoxiella cheracis TaxID=3405120 RepID=UPI003BF4A3EF
MLEHKLFKLSQYAMDRLNEEMAFQLTSLKSVSDAEVPTDIAIDQLASMFADLPEDFQENFVRHVGDSST